MQICLPTLRPARPKTSRLKHHKGFNIKMHVQLSQLPESHCTPKNEETFLAILNTDQDFKRLRFDWAGRLPFVHTSCPTNSILSGKNRHFFRDKDKFRDKHTCSWQVKYLIKSSNGVAQLNMASTIILVPVLAPIKIPLDAVKSFHVTYCLFGVN